MRLLFILLLAAVPAFAQAAPVPLPRLRPAMPAATAAAPAEATPVAPATAAESAGAASQPRVYQTACPALISGLVEAKPLPPISDGQCGTPSPLSVSAVLVNGRLLPLSVPAIFDCQMATDLPGWVADVDNYLWATQNTRIKSIAVGGSYECRDRRVGAPDSDLSEHGRADALDFVGFGLEDGRKLTVAGDYNSPDAVTAKLLHFAHDAACTRFTTVLGPDANGLHADHFHLDLGCHGKTCTYRLCE
ncbi:MAG: extensin family protein [Devosia sp.]|nr:extensin family protein [Devosia sp.]